LQRYKYYSPKRQQILSLPIILNNGIIETNEENLLKEKVLQAFISGEYILSHIKQQR
jgi:hypothetical protein